MKAENYHFRSFKYSLIKFCGIFVLFSYFQEVVTHTQSKEFQNFLRIMNGNYGEPESYETTTSAPQISKLTSDSNGRPNRISRYYSSCNLPKTQFTLRKIDDVSVSTSSIRHMKKFYKAAQFSHKKEKIMAISAISYECNILTFQLKPHNIIQGHLYLSRSQVKNPKDQIFYTPLNYTVYSSSDLDSYFEEVTSGPLEVDHATRMYKLDITNEFIYNSDLFRDRQSSNTFVRKFAIVVKNNNNETIDIDFSKDDKQPYLVLRNKHLEGESTLMNYKFGIVPEVPKKPCDRPNQKCIEDIVQFNNSQPLLKSVIKPASFKATFCTFDCVHGFPYHQPKGKMYSYLHFIYVEKPNIVKFNSLISLCRCSFPFSG